MRGLGSKPALSGVSRGAFDGRGVGLAVPVKSRSGDGFERDVFLDSHTGRRGFGERAERVAVGIAAQAATGIDNARLYEAANRAKNDAAAAMERLELSGGRGGDRDVFVSDAV